MRRRRSRATRRTSSSSSRSSARNCPDSPGEIALVGARVLVGRVREFDRDRRRYRPVAVLALRRDERLLEGGVALRLDDDLGGARCPQVANEGRERIGWGLVGIYI